MRRSFILYDLNQHPAGGSTKIYVKRVTWKKVTYTSSKEEAMRPGILKTILFSFIFGFSHYSDAG